MLFLWFFVFIGLEFIFQNKAYLFQTFDCEYVVNFCNQSFLWCFVLLIKWQALRLSKRAFVAPNSCLWGSNVGWNQNLSVFDLFRTIDNKEIDINIDVSAQKILVHCTLTPSVIRINTHHSSIIRKNWSVHLLWQPHVLQRHKDHTDQPRVGSGVVSK